jgi:hypothetical protein
VRERSLELCQLINHAWQELVNSASSSTTRGKSWLRRLDSSAAATCSISSATALNLMAETGADDPLS